MRRSSAIHAEQLLTRTLAQSKLAYSVHVLNPDGVHRAIKDHPLAVWSGVPRSIAEQHSQNTVCPLLGGRILCSVQLPHGHRLGIQNVGFHMLFIVQTLHTEENSLSMTA